MSWRRPEPIPREQRVAERARRMAAVAATVRGRPDVSMGGSTSGQVLAKECVSQHAGYMAAVRSLGYCMHCRRALAKGEVQFCHRDQGKGLGIKTDVREGWPGCAECHWLIGTSGLFQKQQRRAIELVLGRRTRAAVIAAGLWPKPLPLWEST